MRKSYIGISFQSFQHLSELIQFPIKSMKDLSI